MFVEVMILLILLVGFWCNINKPTKLNIPGPKGLPVFGNSLELVGQINYLDVFQKWTKNHGKRFLVKLGPKLIVHVADAEDMEDILTSPTEIEKSEEYRWLAYWIGDGLLNSAGDKWRVRRRLLTPSFHYTILENFLEMFNFHAIDLATYWESKATSNYFDCYDDLSNVALDAMSETSMGVKMNALHHPETPYVQGVHKFGDLLFFRLMSPWLHNNFIWRLSPWGWKEKKIVKTLHEFTNKVISDRLALRNRKGPDVSSTPALKEHDDDGIFFSKKKRKVFLDTLLDAQSDPKHNLSYDDIREETDTFMFEGHDTTFSAISFCLFCLGNEPEIQAKLYEEINDITGNDINHQFTSLEMNQLKYLDACLKESMRMFPPVPLIFRCLKRNFKFRDGVVVPKKIKLMLNLYQLHKDEKYFPNPGKFDPERFYGTKTVSNSFAYVPFSAGPRNCIGQKFAILETKIVLAHIIRRYAIKSLIPIDEMITYPSMVLRPYKGIMIRLDKRA